MVASESFSEFLREQLAPLGPIAMRRMFGKTGVFCDGVMLAMIRDNTLYFRVDDDNKAAFRGSRGVPAAQLREGRRQHRSRLLARAGAAVRRTR
jgi:DNA transformation protein